MELEQTRDILQQALDQQLEDNRRAVDTNRILADEQTAYANEARGTYYSGLPTWQRAQNAVTSAESLNKVNLSYAQNKNKIWESVADAIDKINAYNEAAAELGGTAATVPTVENRQITTSAPILLNGKYYHYIDGKLREVK